MTAALVRNVVLRPDMTAATDAMVSVELAGDDGKRAIGYLTNTGESVEGLHKPAVDDTGLWSVELTPNDLITPDGTRYKIVERVDGKTSTYYVAVPSLITGPFDVLAILDEAPGALPSTALRAEIDRATDAEAALGAELDAEEAARVAGDATTAAAVTAEASTRATAVSVEATARALADTLLVPLTQRGAPNGVATLDSDGFVPAGQLPPLAISQFLGNVATQAAMLALVGQRGDWCVRTDSDPDKVFLLKTDDPTQLANWTEITTPGAVLSVNGRVGAVTGLAEAADLTTETTARATADTTEATTRAAADTAEASTRANADTTEATARAAADALLLPKAGGTMTGELVVPDLSVGGLAGALAGCRIVGGVSSGSPVSGTFTQRDVVIDNDGSLWICTVGGTPGTWVRIGQPGTETLSVEYSAADQTGITVATDVTGLTGMIPTVGTRPQEILIFVGKLRLVSGTPPQNGGLVLYEDAVAITGCTIPTVPVAGPSSNAATVSPTPLFIRRTAAQMAGKTYKVQFAPAAGSWSVLNTNIACKASFREV